MRSWLAAHNGARGQPQGTRVQECGAGALFFMAAAVSDFYIPWPELPEHKIQSAGGALRLEMANVPKCLGLLRHEWAPRAMHISFKLETDSAILLKKAQGAIEKYGMHGVVANMLDTRKDECGSSCLLAMHVFPSQMPSLCDSAQITPLELSIPAMALRVDPSSTHRVILRCVSHCFGCQHRQQWRCAVPAAPGDTFTGGALLCRGRRFMVCVFCCAGCYWLRAGLLQTGASAPKSFGGVAAARLRGRLWPRLLNGTAATKPAAVATRSDSEWRLSGLLHATSDRCKLVPPWLSLC